MGKAQLKITENSKNLLAKAGDDLYFVKKNIDDQRLHDHCGQNLALATEKLLKFLCELTETQYLTKTQAGHRIVMLMERVTESGLFPFVDQFSDLLDLEVYGSGTRYEYILEGERLDLKKYLRMAEELYRQTLSEYRKLSQKTAL